METSIFLQQSYKFYISSFRKDDCDEIGVTSAQFGFLCYKAASSRCTLLRLLAGQSNTQQ